MNISKMPTIQLNNGLRIANFNIPHNIVFNDGSILPACEVDRLHFLCVKPVSEEIKNDTPWNDLRKVYKIDDVIKKEIRKAKRIWGIDIILITPNLMMSIKNTMISIRNCRVAYPINGTNTIFYSDRFYI